MSDEQLAPDDEYGDPVEESRTILSSLWFRAVLVIATVGVVGASAMPHVLRLTAPSAGLTPPAVVPPVQSPAVAAPLMVPAAPAIVVPSASVAPADAVAANPTVPAGAVEARVPEASLQPAPRTPAPAATPAITAPP